MAGDVRIERWGVPKPSRLATAADTARRMLDRPFREGLSSDENGKHRIVIADADDRMGEVFSRYWEIGPPVTFSVRVGSLGLVPITMFQKGASEIEDKQACTEDTTFGMVISLLLNTGAPINLTVCDPEPAGYQLSFA